jgi:hypothetical protein
MHALQLLGKARFDHSGLVTEFFTGRHFQTYAMERTPSLSANCNALKTLLVSEDLEKYSTCITGTLSYLCDAWYYDTMVTDKWVSLPSNTKGSLESQPLIFG